jgi:hypothetical protein
MTQKMFKMREVPIVEWQFLDQGKSASVVRSTIIMVSPCGVVC